MSDGPAFVAGATGFTGKAVVKVLRERGLRTVAHVRPDSARLSQWREFFGALGAEVDATPWDEAAMTATLTRLQPSPVFALLGTTRRRMGAIKRAGGDPRSADYEAVDYGLTAMLIRAARNSGAKPRFVYLSAVGVKESARAAYYRARVKAEGELKASGLPYIIARPSFITGPGRDEARWSERAGAGMFDALLAAVGAVGAKKLQAHWSSTTDLALAQALVRLALDPARVNLTAEPEDLRL
jgi:uncharacterized protein YbjT (DUF2867 family)